MSAELNMKFETLEEMAEFLRRNGYYVSKTYPVERVIPMPYPVYPQPVQPLPQIPITYTVGDDRPMRCSGISTDHITT